MHLDADRHGDHGPSRIDGGSACIATVAPPASTTAPTEQAAAFPFATFAASEDPVTEEAAAKFQAALNEMLNLPLKAGIEAGGGGMSATVMTAGGTWSGTAGRADGIRAIQADDQFAIGSITKSVVAAQMMHLVEAGAPIDTSVQRSRLNPVEFGQNVVSVSNDRACFHRGWLTTKKLNADRGF